MALPSRRRSIWLPVTIAAVVVVMGATLALTDGIAAQEAATITAPDSVYDPVMAGESLPAGYRRGLDRDQIEPVYNPLFTTAAGVDWPIDSLVIGVAGQDTAKAYPVTHLNSHEMVIDSLEGIPILVTW